MVSLLIYNMRMLEPAKVTLDTALSSLPTLRMESNESADPVSMREVS